LARARPARRDPAGRLARDARPSSRSPQHH
jgi:hypothetical protein